ncbi:hypothetical protein ColTof4_14052 [Colletotrichum tofieldiae]|nr:hypothetical protein ColTof4_14052 [Colletotrichum tofieldiae]
MPIYRWTSSPAFFGTNTDDGGFAGPTHGPTHGHIPGLADGHGRHPIHEERRYPKSTPPSTPLHPLPLYPHRSTQTLGSPFQAPRLFYPTTTPSSPQSSERKRNSPSLPQPLFKTAPDQIRLLSEAERQEQQQQACAVDTTRYSLLARETPGLSSIEAAAVVCRRGDSILPRITGGRWS